MPTTVEFNTQYGATGGAGVSSAGSVLRITAVVDDGDIVQGDHVIVSGVDSSIDINTGISNGMTVIYSGLAKFGEIGGFVLSPMGTMPGMGPALVGTYEERPSPDTMIAVRDFANGTEDQLLAPDPACFLTGTEIATPTGPRKVEDLGSGDLVQTADGRAVPVLWVGRQLCMSRFGIADRLRPVRIAAGALGPGLPTRDLYVTADHGLFLGGVLVNAGALVNASTITWVDPETLGPSYTVYHIETEAHEMLLAEGAPAESFVDYAQRSCFDNLAEYPQGDAAARPIFERPEPRVTRATQLPAQLRAQLAARAAAGREHYAGQGAA